MRRDAVLTHGSVDVAWPPEIISEPPADLTTAVSPPVRSPSSLTPENTRY
jgi:hypothetical protein